MKCLIDGVETCYSLYGPESGEKVLLLHGWGCNRQLMEPVADALKDRFRILIPDFPGHGGSGRPPVPWGVEEYAEHTLKLMNRLSFIPSAVIAHSFGCRVATVLSAGHPELFTKLIFTGAAGIRPAKTKEAEERSRKYREWKKRALALQKIPVLGKAGKVMEEKLREKYGSRDYNALDEEMRKTFVKVVNRDLIDLYPNIRQSTLLLWGDNDTETPLWMGEKICDMIPDAGLVVLEGGSHFAYLEQAKRFNTIVLNFLSEE